MKICLKYTDRIPLFHYFIAKLKKNLTCFLKYTRNDLPMNKKNAKFQSNAKHKWKNKSWNEKKIQNKIKSKSDKHKMKNEMTKVQQKVAKTKSAT